VAGGCGLVAVVVIAGGVFGAITLVSRLQHGGFNCLPSDFPRYPGATYSTYSFELNGPTPGNSCHMVFKSNSSTSAVLDFYQSKLDTGGWQVTSSNRDIGLIAFRKVNTTSTKGTVQVSARDGYAEIDLQLYSR